MTTIYQVVDKQGCIRGTFVFLNDAQYFVQHEAPLCHIRSYTFDKHKKKGGKKNENA